MELDPPVGSAPAILEFHDVSFSVPEGPTILRNVSLRVEPGKTTVVVGPSGAGKSTLLRLGNRLEVPTTGSVSFLQEDLSKGDPRWLRRRIGMVFQKPVLFAGTVRSNLAVADPHATDAVLTHALQRVGLEGDMLDRIADDLSGGEAQRMCIARTLLTEPEVLLMDEPTSSLDPDNRIGIEQLARELTAEGISILWITHDLAQARRLGDRIEMLIDGRNATSMEAENYLDQESREFDS